MKNIISKGKKIYFLMLAGLLFFFCSMAGLVYGAPIVCGIATGYPPYQFVGPDGDKTGFDAEIMRLVAEKLDRDLVFIQMNWDDIVALLKYSEDLDCVCGMEITSARLASFELSTPYYYRRNAVFIRESSSGIKDIEDLAGRLITGDKDSFVESRLKELGLFRQIRVLQVGSKDESMQLLKNGRVEAVVMPRAVGIYLAKKHDIEVKLLEDPDPGSPVGIAVKKGNSRLLEDIENTLKKLLEEGTIERLYQEWFGRVPPK